MDTQLLLLAALTGTILALAGYFKNAGPGAPDIIKIIVNAAGGALVGVIIIYETGGLPTEATVVLYIGAITGYLTLAEYILKGIVRRKTDQPGLDLKYF